MDEVVNIDWPTVAYIISYAVLREIVPLILNKWLPARNQERMKRLDAEIEARNTTASALKIIGDNLVVQTEQMRELHEDHGHMIDGLQEATKHLAILSDRVNGRSQRRKPVNATTE